MINPPDPKDPSQVWYDPVTKFVAGRVGPGEAVDLDFITVYTQSWRFRNAYVEIEWTPAPTARRKRHRSRTLFLRDALGPFIEGASGMRVPERDSGKIVAPGTRP